MDWVLRRPSNFHQYQIPKVVLPGSTTFILSTFHFLIGLWFLFKLNIYLLSFYFVIKLQRIA